MNYLRKQQASSLTGRIALVLLEWAIGTVHEIECSNVYSIIWWSYKHWFWIGHGAGVCFWTVGKMTLHLGEWERSSFRVSRWAACRESSFTGDVKRGFKRGLSWHQFIVEDGCVNTFQGEQQQTFAKQKKLPTPLFIHLPGMLNISEQRTIEYPLSGFIWFWTNTFVYGNG